MKHLLALLILFSSLSHASRYFAEVDVLNPVFNLVGTSQSLRNDLRLGMEKENWHWALRYAHELGVPSDSEGVGVNGKDGNAHHLGLRGAYRIFEKGYIGGGYLFTLFDAKTSFSGENKKLSTSASGFEVFINYRWDFKDCFLKSEFSYHHLFSNLKKVGSGGLAEYDVGQGKLMLLVGKEF